MISIINDVCLFLIEYYHEFVYLFCKKQLMSRRNLDKIRNNIAWNRLLFHYIKEPHNIYENRYEILYVEKNNLYSGYIQQLRTKEFLNLKSFQYLVALLYYIEIQDFIMPKVINFIVYLGQFFLFILGSIHTLIKWPINK
uniref:Conserved hypothetical plastid protein n=1 Tax=Porphyridium purpureum TaxID=35688 RepID=W0RYR0_PORPP|nr:conserved hypothetical plastid protein [Porphyridium purpureum]ATJ02932.1 hypothetical protein [Porphyridium purpureum]BAO23711.1 conserved hypothetical plastid protein [Porphyridium purpureum]